MNWIIKLTKDPLGIVDVWELIKTRKKIPSKLLGLSNISESFLRSEFGLSDNNLIFDIDDSFKNFLEDRGCIKDNNFST